MKAYVGRNEGEVGKRASLSMRYNFLQYDYFVNSPCTCDYTITPLHLFTS